MAAPLSQLQAWFQEQLTNLGEATPGWSVDDVIEPSLLRTPAERLSVYQNAYVARLVECLQAEFAAVNRAVGNDAFLQFAAAHLQRHPPHSYTLGRLGAEFAETLAALRPPRDGNGPDFADFLVQLATYERTVNEAFDAEGPERCGSPAAGCALTVESLAGLSPDEFADCRLEFYPCVRLLALSFPVHEYVTAVRHDREPPPMTPREVRLVVHRRDYVVRRWEAPAWQFALLRELHAGQTIGAALQRVPLASVFARQSSSQSLLQPDSNDTGGPALSPVAPNESAPDAAALFAAFEEWARAQLFRRILVPIRQ